MSTAFLPDQCIKWPNCFLFFWFLNPKPKYQTPNGLLVIWLWVRCEQAWEKHTKQVDAVIAR